MKDKEPSRSPQDVSPAPDSEPAARSAGLASRRQFLRTAVAGAAGGFVAFTLPGLARAILPDPLPPGFQPPLLDSIPESNAQALALYQQSISAQRIVQHVANKYSLRFEADRAFMMECPVDQPLPPGGAQDLPSLVGESSYAAFLGDNVAQGALLPAQIQTLGSPDRVALARNLSQLVGIANDVGLMVGCSCSSCSSCCCSCSCCFDTGPMVWLIAVFSFGDPDVDPNAPPGTSYFRGSMAVSGHQLGASAVVLSTETGPSMDAVAGTLIMVNNNGNVVELPIDPATLNAMGAQDYATLLFQ